VTRKFGIILLDVGVLWVIISGMGKHAFHENAEYNRMAKY